MQAARWEQVKAVFHATLEQAAGERAAFLASACHGDADLREEIESLLAAHGDASDFMEAPAFTQESTPDPLPAGGHAGPYALVREIGRGGMGAVYLAERDDGEFRRQVAVKLVKRGMDTELILRRFRHERQILAQLDHPNIARLLDGGTTADGLPYFVMEYIEGESISRYCDASDLSVAGRLSVFRDVCAAVHYAHQRLVVHRDIKPANIVVTPDGTAKLLDFGIATLLSAADAHGPTPTAAALRAMTPEYASPEQLRGEPVTTLSDVYSLGVLLHELLTGHPPCPRVAGAPADGARAVAAAELPRPSACTDDPRRHRPLRGDLDNIVLMALRTEPDRRYASAAQLSEDVRRHLEGLPVIARPDALVYRSAKFMRRHRTAVTAAVVVLASLVGGMAATAREARIARSERARAERRFDDVRGLATSFLFEFHDAIRDLPGATRARELVVRRALVSLDGLAREAQGDAVLQRDLAAAYLKVGDVQGLPNTPNLGQTDGALASYRKALALLGPLATRLPHDAAVRHDLSVAHQRLGRLEARAGERARAIASGRRALAISEALAAEAPDAVAYRRLMGENALFLGRAVYTSPRVADVQEGLALFQRSLGVREALLAAAPADAAAGYAVAQSLESIGYAQWRLGDMALGAAGHRAALGTLRRAHAMRIVLRAADPANVRARRAVPDGDREIGELQAMLGDPRAAIVSFRNALAEFEPLAAQDPTNAQAQQDVAQSHAGLADALARSGQPGRAVPHARQALALFERRHAADRRSADELRLVLSARASLARLLAAAGDATQAARAYRAAAALAELPAVAALPPTRALAALHADVARGLAAAGDRDAANRSQARAVRVREAFAAANPDDTAAQRELAAARAVAAVSRAH